MSHPPERSAQRQSWRSANPRDLRRHQLTRLNLLLHRAVSDHEFYRHKYAGIDLPLDSLDDITRIPLLEKREMLSDRNARICGLSHDRYVRVHQTSGTTGRPLRVLDTAEDWSWWLDCWQYILDAANITPHDSAFLAFSYGPFIGFWTAHESLVARGVKVIPGGGMDSVSRLNTIRECEATVLCCTPTYALHLIAVAARHGIDLRSGSIRKIIVAGEPGGSIPEVRSRIESAWGAQLIDHSGATEVGAWGFGTVDGKGLHVIESEFIAELLVFTDTEPHGRPANEGELSELVITGLGRYGAPAIRYRTGDLVRGRRDDTLGNRFLVLDGGIIGRADNMVVVRGVNIFPSSIEAVVRHVAGNTEYRVIQSQVDAMTQLRVEIEVGQTGFTNASELTAKLTAALREQLGLRIDVRSLPTGTLPRSEGKSKRWFVENGSRAS